MNREEELRLIERFLAHLRAGTRELATACRIVPSTGYYAAAAFAREQETLFDRLPTVQGPANAELPIRGPALGPLIERYGLRWRARTPADVERFLAGLGPDLEALDLRRYAVFGQCERRVAANWKTVMEGTLDSYHMPYVHAPGTAEPYLAPLLVDRFGPHQRIIVGHPSLASLTTVGPARRHLRHHVTMTYQLAPATTLTTHPDRLYLAQVHPEGPHACWFVWTVLVPMAAMGGAWDSHWRALAALYDQVVAEDAQAWERQGRLLRVGGVPAMIFGRHEVPLMAFRDGLEIAMAAGPVRR